MAALVSVNHVLFAVAVDANDKSVKAAVCGLGDACLVVAHFVSPSFVELM